MRVSTHNRSDADEKGRPTMASSSRNIEENQAAELESTEESRSTSMLKCLTCRVFCQRRKSTTPRLEFKEQSDSVQSTPRPAKRDQDSAVQSAEASTPGGGAPTERVAVSAEKSSTTKDESEKSSDAENSRYCLIAATYRSCW